MESKAKRKSGYIKIHDDNPEWLRVLSDIEVGVAKRYPRNPNIVAYKDGRIFSHFKNIFIKQNKTRAGYYYFSIRYDKDFKSVSVHRVIGETFLGLTPNMMINHINGIKTDNRLENLEICNRSENTKHSIYTLGNNHLLKLDDVKILTIHTFLGNRKRILKNETIELEKSLKISCSHIKRIAQGENYPKIHSLIWEEKVKTWLENNR